MASTPTTPSVLTGFFKEIYGSEQINLIPDHAIIQKMIPFCQKDKENGKKFVQNVIVTQEHGISYAASTAGAFALNDSLSMTTQSAEVVGSMLALRSQISYDVATKASNSKKAFGEGIAMVIENMSESVADRIEANLLYGASNLGNADSSAVASSKVTLTVDAAAWASGLWAGKEGARIAVYDGTTVFGPFVISTIDHDARTIAVAAATESKGQDAGTGVLTDIDSLTDLKLFYFGSVAVGTGLVYREALGLDKIITTSGTLFNIDNAAYSLWKGNEATISGAITMSGLVKALNKPVGKGGLKEDVVALVNPIVWEKLNSDLAALRSLDHSYKPNKGENGVESIQYHYQGGKIDVVSHSMVKQGEIFVIPPKRFSRLGSTDVTFKIPGREGDLFLNLPDNMGFELRCFSDQALFPETVAKCLKISGFDIP